MPFLVRETNTALRLVLVGAYVIAIVFCAAGIWLVYLGASGTSEMSLFGTQFKSTSVGVASLFLAAVTVVLLVRRSLQTMESAIQRETPSDADDRETLPGLWPATKTQKALRQKVATLSTIQWTLIQTVERLEGQGVHHVVRDCGVGPSAAYHRLRSLAVDDLVVIHKGEVHLSPNLKRALGRRNLTDLRPPNPPIQPTGSAGG